MSVVEMRVPWPIHYANRPIATARVAKPARARHHDAPRSGKIDRKLYLLPFVLMLALVIVLSIASERHATAPSTFAASEASATPPPASTSTSQDVRQQPAAGSMNVALTSFIERQYGGGTYVGPCENAVSPRDLWKRCTKLWADQGDRLAFLEGPTFSEFTRWIFVRRQSDGNWQVYGEAPFNFFGDARTIPWP